MFLQSIFTRYTIFYKCRVTLWSLTKCFSIFRPFWPSGTIKNSCVVVFHSFIVRQLLLSFMIDTTFSQDCHTSISFRLNIDIHPTRSRKFCSHMLAATTLVHAIPSCCGGRVSHFFVTERKVFVFEFLYLSLSVLPIHPSQPSHSSFPSKVFNLFRQPIFSTAALMRLPSAMFFFLYFFCSIFSCRHRRSVLLVRATCATSSPADHLTPNLTSRCFAFAVPLSASVCCWFHQPVSDPVQQGKRERAVMLWSSTNYRWW